MQQKGLLWSAPIAALALVLGCSGGDKQPASPTSPSGSTSASATGATSDAVTLKVNAPVLTSPIGGTRLTTAQVTVTFQAAAAKYVTGQTFNYRVQLLDAASNMLDEKIGTATSYTFPVQFEPDTLYRWRVRAELQGQAGPWSTTETFRSMLKPTSYMRGNELYDALDDGKTVGTIVGDATFIPGQGLRINTEETYVEYRLPQQITGGEYSILVTGLTNCCNTEDPKLRVMTMREGDAAINDNLYRMSADKRGNGAVAYRFISGNNSSGQYVETNSSERVPYRFQEHLWYFYRATWWNNTFTLTVKENGIDGTDVFDSAKPYKGIYQPLPHNVYLGSPYAPGDRGEPSSYDGMVIRQVWCSPNPRPSWAQ